MFIYMKFLVRFFSWNFDSLACSAYSLSLVSFWWLVSFISWDGVNPFATWNGTIFQWFSISHGIAKAEFRFLQA
jgi:hypothetical protein